MDGTILDRLARTVARAGTRRAALGALLAGTALGPGRWHYAAAQPISCALKAKGEPCGTDAACCSGRCKRNRVCRQADHQGLCSVAQNHCAGIGSDACGINSSDFECLCYVTAQGRSFCGDSGSSAGSCDCTSNKQCVRRHGLGFKCIQNEGCGGCSTNKACIPACPNLYPV